MALDKQHAKDGKKAILWDYTNTLLAPIRCWLPTAATPSAQARRHL